jgi:hypothetical protein
MTNKLTENETIIKNLREEMTTKLTENEATITNLREEIEKLTKIQEQQKQQVISIKINKI